LLEEVIKISRQVLDSKIQFNFAYPLAADFDFKKKEDIDLVLNLLSDVAKHGISHITLVLDKFVETTKHKELANSQSLLVNALLKKLADSNLNAEIYVLPTFATGDFKGENPLGRKQLEYWRDLHRLLGKSCKIFFEGPSTISDTISNQFASDLQACFQGRQLILWDNFPPSNNNSNLLFLHSYKGRDPKLFQIFTGVVSNPLQSIGASLITISTIFDYLRSPLTYEPEASLKSALLGILSGT
jgi:hypothetical protein